MSAITWFFFPLQLLQLSFKIKDVTLSIYREDYVTQNGFGNNSKSPKTIWSRT